MDPHRYLPRQLPQPLEGLVELALDLRWTWHRGADPIWRALDEELWEATGNPWVILEDAPQRVLESLARDEDFIQILRAQHTGRLSYLQDTTWFETAHAAGELKRVAYFSMEFGLSEALPIYSGGLGILAGDFLKSASDLGVPVIGVGILYQQGYFHQALDASGHQLEFFPYNDPAMLPVQPVRDAKGDRLLVTVDLPGRSLYLQAWQAQIGRITLYLLDSNYLLNRPSDRGVTSELYGGGSELRLQQELVLGIGGYRLLSALGLDCEVCHLNEGHAAFAVLERGLMLMKRERIRFDEALQATRAGNIFTTHTPVAAGFDRFPPPLVAQYLETYSRELGIPLRDLLALGRVDPSDDDEPFNMAHLAVRGAGHVNGVSRLHGAVSRRLFASLFPRWPEREVPIGHVTNGIHVPSWTSAGADDLWSSLGGFEPWRGTLEGLNGRIRSLGAEELWGFRTRGRAALITSLRERMDRQHAGRGVRPEERAAREYCLDPNILTLGFARRFASYKRPTLLLKDPERLVRLLTHPETPVQLVVAGKAHPRDEAGRQMVAAWSRFIHERKLFHRVVFVEDYDITLASELVQGIDLWLNTPRRPWEASGTSGMKVLANGGLNLSVLDGWWAEAYAPEVGWALGDGREHGPEWDARDADQLYQILEQEIVPVFYARDGHGIPQAWIERMRESMARLTLQFSANRMVREYTTDYYVPAAAAFRRRSANGAAAARQLAAWIADVERKWSALRFGSIEVTGTPDQHRFEVAVYLDDLAPESVRVELYAEPATADGPPERHIMRREKPLSGAINGYLYTASVRAARPSHDYTPRIVPEHAEARVPLDVGRVLWQR
jgi:starch phosphorylase